MNLPSLWLLQYLIAAGISLAVSFYVIYQEEKSHPPSAALRYLFTFGLSIFVWENLAYLQRSASNLNDAFTYLRLLSISGVLSQSTYLAAVLSIRKKIRVLPLVFLPAWINVCTVPFVSYDFHLTQYGWSYRVAQPSAPLIIAILIYLGYLVATVISLIKLVWEARSKPVSYTHLTLPTN